MAKKQGTQTKAAFLKSTTWGTATAGTAGLYVKTPADVVHARELVENEAVGEAFVDSVDYGNITAITDDIGGDLHYEGWDVPLALSMGTAGTPTDNTGSYTHKLQLNDSLDGLFGSYAAIRGTDIFEYPSVKVHGFELTGEAGQAVQIALKNIRDRLIGPGDASSQTFTSANFSSLTYADIVNRVMANQGVFRLNMKSDGALGSASTFGTSDVVCPGSFTFGYTRPMEGDYVICSTNNGYVIEPTATDVGNREAMYSLTFPQYDTSRDNALITKYLDDAVEARLPLKGDITFSGDTISGAYAYECKIEMPHLIFESVESVTPGVGKIPGTYNFRLLGSSSAPTGMTALTKPFQISFTNTRSTDPLT